METNIEIYQLEDGKTEIVVQLENETVWLSLNQMVDLFGRDKSVISRHIKNIFREKELERNSVVAKNATTAVDGKVYQVDFYNLDVIISVGYRIKSIRGTQFRIWANKILKNYLVKGYAINTRRFEQKAELLKELQDSVKVLRAVINFKPLSNDESLGLLKIISDYAYALDILDQYDYQKLKIENTSGKEKYQLTYDEAIKQIKVVKKVLGNSDLFGREKDKSFRSSIATVYQTYEGRDLYPSLEEKSANLLYFITKNHSFIDGNKRIADNTLVALTLMVAVSKPEEKDTMIKVIVNLINKNN